MFVKGVRQCTYIGSWKCLEKKKRDKKALARGGGGGGGEILKKRKECVIDRGSKLRLPSLLNILKVEGKNDTVSKMHGLERTRIFYAFLLLPKGRLQVLT